MGQMEGPPGARELRKRKWLPGGYGPDILEGGRGSSPGPLPCDEDENSADGDQPILEGGHGQDGELGPALQGKNRQEPPVPGRPAGQSLQKQRSTPLEPLHYTGDTTVAHGAH